MSILRFISDRLPARQIRGPDGEPYLEPYYICTLLGWRFYLHKFVDSDPDRGLHDHPWLKAYAIILAGWYIEHRRHGYAPVRWFNSLTGDTFHRVILPNSKPVWTLFFHRAAGVKDWGFWRTNKDGTASFEPYRYEREGSQKDWWLTAPKGRDLRKQSKNGREL